MPEPLLITGGAGFIGIGSGCGFGWALPNGWIEALSLAFPEVKQ